MHFFWLETLAHQLPDNLTDSVVFFAAGHFGWQPQQGSSGDRLFDLPGTQQVDE